MNNGSKCYWFDVNILNFTDWETVMKLTSGLCVFYIVFSHFSYCVSGGWMFGWTVLSFEIKCRSCISLTSCVFLSDRRRKHLYIHSSCKNRKLPSQMTSCPKLVFQGLLIAYINEYYVRVWTGLILVVCGPKTVFKSACILLPCVFCSRSRIQ